MNELPDYQQRQYKYYLIYKHFLKIQKRDIISKLDTQRMLCPDFQESSDCLILVKNQLEYFSGESQLHEHKKVYPKSFKASFKRNGQHRVLPLFLALWKGSPTDNSVPYGL